MALQAMGVQGWEARPVQSKASVSLATGALTAAQVLDLATQAAAAVEDAQGWVRPLDREANRLRMVVRDLTREDNEPVLHFDVEVDRAVGRVTARTVIQSFVLKQSAMSGLVPMTKRKIAGFTAYRAFMQRYAAMVSAADAGAHVSYSGD
ncbi:hypothetical protein [Cellulomonas shaoxiangyii]|uniref:Uncharacterized protein n=1 Tax=Cellulomonas shaoxiangyii TaxID=2566013 RepID=A0A4P7SIM7_9CELL|nr:hypothetical protein [Cellulomonas shaoxiangyii]QCB93498.1 hypothetical protein E5225_07915 [Cellulomonas shaoxiangyii]TGY86820.1 hypothetical protein E5226_00235 [Cellulomonas shaoxiangyii]